MIDNYLNFPMVLHQATLQWRALLNKRLKPLGLSQAKWRALLILAKAKQPLTQCELATLLEIEPPTVVGLVDRLSQAGWVERQAGKDRRIKYIHLTKQAKAVIDPIQTTAGQVHAELLAEVTPEDLNTCIRVLEQIKQKAEQSHE